MIAEHAKRHYYDVHIHAAGGVGQGGAMRCRVIGIEPGRRHVDTGQFAAQCGHRSIQPQARTASEGDPAQARPGQRPDNRQADFRGASKEQHRLRLTHRIHHSPSLRLRSERNKNVGSTDSRIAWNSASRGYPAAIVSAVARESLAR